MQKASSQCEVDYTTYSYFCDLDSLILEAVPVSGAAPFTYIWETGETTQQIIIPLALGDYMLTMTDANGCTSIINCHIKPFPDVLYYPFNQNACEGDTVTLFLEWFRDSIPGATYLWSTGETTPTIQLTDDLVWSVTVTDPSNGCEFVIPPGLFEFHYTPYPEIVGSNILCNGQSTTLSVEGGPFGTIYWLPDGIYEPTLVVTEPGEYIVWTSSPTAGYCWHQDTIIITDGDINPPTLTGPPDLCDGQTGMVEVTNDALFETFLWATGETTPTITVDEPGTYTVTATNDQGCTASAQIVVGVGDGPDLDIIATAATCGESNGTIYVTALPPQTYTYQWSNGTNGPEINNAPPGTYSVTVTDPNGCTATGTEIIPDNPIVITINETITPNSSCTDWNGAINLFVNPNGQPFIYQWSNGATTEDVENLFPGSYSVTVTLGVNCIQTSDYLVEDISGAAEISHTLIPTTCGESNGTIQLQLTGGIGPFTYSWSNGETTDLLENIPAGNYSVTVTGSDGCISIENIQLPNEDPVIMITGNSTPNTSCNSANGEIDITVLPSEFYDFNWSNGSTSEDLINIPAGNYTVTVTLGNTCSQEANFTVINESIPFTVSGNTTPNFSCISPNGSIDLNLTPAGNYTYLWSNGAMSEDLQNLLEGSYTVTVTDDNGCNISSIFQVLNMVTAPVITGQVTHNTSCDQANGAIDISTFPSGSNTYVWTNGMITEDIQNLSGGTYGVTVTDANGCTASSSFMIEDSSLVLNIHAVPIHNTSCSSPNGSIDIIVTPAGTYSYLWSNGATTEDIQALTGGNYTLTITSIDGCSISSSFAIVDSITPILISGSVINNTSCQAGNGSVNLTINPAGTYTFLWSHGANTEDLQSLNAGAYIVTVTDQNGCSGTSTFIISNNTADPVITSIVGNEECNSGNGMIDLTTSPAGNIFLWSTGAATEDLSNLAAGSYTVTVTSLNGCIAIDTFLVQNASQNFSLNANVADNSSCTTPLGAIDLTITPQGTYTIIWSNGISGEDLTNLDAGIYTVTVTDNSGCSSTASFSVLNTSVPPIIDTTIMPASCGSSNGSISLSITPSNGNQFQWSTGFTGQSLENIPAGIYTVTVTSSGGCTAVGSFEVLDQNSNISIAGTIIDNTSCTSPNGSIVLDINPPGSYSYQWSTGSTNKDIANLIEGTYSVTVADGSGCNTSYVFNISNNTILPLISEIITPAVCGQNNGSVDISVQQTNNNSFLWSNGNISEDLINTFPGVYTVTVTSPQGCTTIATFNIPNQNSNFSLSTGITDDQSCISSTGAIDLTVIPGGSYTFTWSTGATTEDLQGLNSGIYTVTVTDALQCSTFESFIIENATTTPILSATLLGETCGLSDGMLDLTIVPSGGNQILWSNGAGSEDLDGVAAGQYSVTVTDINGCTNRADFIVPGTPGPEVVIDADLSGINQGGLVSCSLQLNLPLGAIESIQWSPDEMMSCHDILCMYQQFYISEQTQIFVMIVDTNGCTGQASLLVDIEAEYRVYIPNVFTPNNDGPNDMFTIFTNEEVEEVVILQIFDRWGNMVFENQEFPPNEPNYGWDGIYKGKMMNPDVFAYRAVVKYSNGELHPYKGDVTLIR